MESHSGKIYEGLTWYNHCDNPDKWLKSIYDKEDIKDERN